MPKKSGKPAPKKSTARSGKPQLAKAQPHRKASPPEEAKRPAKPVNAWQITRKSALTLWEYKRLFIGITVVYGLLTFVLGQGLAGGADTSVLKQDLSQVSSGHGSWLTAFTALIGSSSAATDQTTGAYRIFMTLIGSLALIWALRQVLTGTRPRIRDAYYKGMYPLVPFLLVLGVISIQLIPLAIGSALFTTVISTGIALYAAEKAAWFLLFVVLAIPTIYMLSSSFFALYIVTLPDMTPLKALRSARDLVRCRRWAVLRKILFLPLVLLAAAAIIMLPIIIVLTPLSQAVFFILTICALPAVHAYMYTLYRELLDE